MEKKNKKNFDKWFLLTWKKLWIIIVFSFIFILFHNAFYAIFNVEEAFFLILVIFVIPVYFMACVVYSLIKKKKKIYKLNQIELEC
jgi:hypothetical protein